MPHRLREAFRYGGSSEIPSSLDIMKVLQVIPTIAYSIVISRMSIRTLRLYFGNDFLIPLQNRTLYVLWKNEADDSYRTRSLYVFEKRFLMFRI